MPPMRGCDAACPQAPASAAAVWAGRPLMRRLRIRRNRRTRARSPTTEVASTDARRTNFPVSCRHSRTPIIRHGRPAKDEADLSSLRGAHEARQATALARPQTPRGPPVSVHRLRACRHGRVARAGGRIIEAEYCHVDNSPMLSVDRRGRPTPLRCLHPARQKLLPRHFSRPAPDGQSWGGSKN